MKLMGQNIGSMYLWAIALLILVVGSASYASAQFPLPLVLAVAVAVAIDAFIERMYLRRALRFPVSAVITGLIIGSVAPLNAPLPLVLFAVIIALMSKHFIKTKRGNVFNPAAFGLLIALFLFSVGDDWWAAANFNVLGLALTITPILAIAAYKAHRLTASVSFVAAAFVMAILLSHSVPSPQSLVVSLLGINFFFAFIMVAEPKTSPHDKRLQAAFGAGIAVVYMLLASYGVTYSILLALLVGNLAYAAYRSGWRPS